MKVLVTAKLSDEKLRTKLVGLQACEGVSEILLVRAVALDGDKIRPIAPSHSIAGNTVLFEVWRFFTVLRLLRRPDVDVCFGIQFFLHGMVSIICAALAGKKSIVWLIGSDAMIYGRKLYLRSVFECLLNKTDVVLTMGEVMNSALPPKIASRCVEMQSFIDPEVYSFEGLDIVYDVCFVGNLVPVKQVDILLDACALLKSKGVLPRVVIVGDGIKKSSLEKKARDLCIKDLVSFAGFQINVADYLRSTRVVALMSRSEGLPAILLEASFCGAPCVVPDVGEIRTRFAGYNHVRLLEKTDSLTLSVHIEALMSMGDKRESLRADAFRFRQDYLAKWGKGSLKNKWENLLLGISHS